MNLAVTELIPNPEGSTNSPDKKALLQAFKDTFLKHVLYRKKKDGFGKLLANKETLKNDAYFIDKSTLANILYKIVDAEADGLWVNFGFGPTTDRGDEIQLVLTVAKSEYNNDTSDIGNYCVTTANIGNPTDPPFTGIPNPKDPE